ncbi:hypothetical protein [Campylobacter devanensis]|uniref:hypothetical protein n=1 Tax=Campylobacter devanensis TaxID=3161138 RepID=UPI000A34BAB9|nr:hypothetical protein [Campylobacter sp. P0106]
MSLELVKVTDKNEIKEDENIIYIDTATKVATEITRDIAVLQNGSELLKCSVSIDLLQKAKDGDGLLGIILKNGKIKEQARFNPADLKGIIAPATLYNVLSIAVGQHFMYEIKTELNQINKRLDEIVAYYFKGERNFSDEKIIARINAMMSELEYINNTKLKSSEDVMMLRQLAFKAEEIRQYAKIKLYKEKDIGCVEIYKSSEKINEYSYFLLWQYYLQNKEYEKADENRDKFFYISEYLQKEYRMFALNYNKINRHRGKPLENYFYHNNLLICERKNLKELNTVLYIAIKNDA